MADAQEIQGVRCVSVRCLRYFQENVKLNSYENARIMINYAYFNAF